MNAVTTEALIKTSVRYEPLLDRLRSTLCCLLACALLSSCALFDRSKVTPPEPVPEPRAEKAPPPPKKIPRVTILQSDSIQAYTGITDELVAQLPARPTIINLQGDRPSGTEIIDKLKQAGNKHIVAIGSLAAEAARQYTDGKVIFCQVFNYKNLGLTAANMRGVSMLPPAKLQFRAWKEFAPGLQRVGVITGDGHEALIAEARKAAQHHGIELIHRVVRSDKGMLYAFKRLTPGIQGLWLVPDDRVLSLRVLRDIMAYGVKHQRQVVVFNPKLLRLGGIMSVGSIDSDVAKQVIAALKKPSRRNKSSAHTLLPLKKIHVETNPRVINELARLSHSGIKVAADAP